MVICENDANWFCAESRSRTESLSEAMELVCADVHYVPAMNDDWFGRDEVVLDGTIHNHRRE